MSNNKRMYNVVKHGTVAVAGLGGAKINFQRQLANLNKQGTALLQPTVIGECGIPFDINNKEILQGTLKNHCNFLDAILSGMESNFMHFTLWNYNVLNSTKHGDHWNGEDFSIFNATATVNNGNTHYAGGRVLEAVIRPYATRIAGEPVRQWFDRQKRLEYGLEFKNEGGNFKEWLTASRQSLGNILHAASTELEETAAFQLNQTTMVYLPDYHYAGKQVNITVSDGRWTYDVKCQHVVWEYSNKTAGYKHWMMVNVRQEEDVQRGKAWHCGCC